MSFRQIFKASLIAFTLFLIAGHTAAQNLPLQPASRLLPNQLRDFQAIGNGRPLTDEVSLESGVVLKASDDFKTTSAAERTYRAKDGSQLAVKLFITSSEAAAYSRLTSEHQLKSGAPGTGKTLAHPGIGTSGFWAGDSLVFYRGPHFVSITASGANTRDGLIELGSALAATLPAGQGDIPTLVKHLPDFQNVNQGLLYSVSSNMLTSSVPDHTVLSVIDFAGGTEAVQARYGDFRLVIIEFTTPQLAGEADRNIIAKLGEISAAGAAAPSSYRRVGNYSVFVFDAPSEEAANRLIDQVKYEQVVQWLGDNPYLYERATREFAETTLGVFVAVFKASGLVIVGSLAMGGLIGALLFNRRRRQQGSAEAYSDAGGMVRLNLDELTGQKNPPRLLSRGN